MTKILILLINDFISGIIDYFNKGFLTDLADLAFHAEQHMNKMGINGLQNIFNIFINFGVSLIILKFLKKGFDIYVLWSDGDADLEPMTLLINFLKAMTIALTFSVIYGWIVSIMEDLITRVLDAAGLNISADISLLEILFSNKTLFEVSAYLVFFIFLVILYVQFIKQGLSILIIRVGLPLACVGIMDANGGVFNSYIQKLLQLTLSVLVQVVLMKIGFSLVLAGHLIWGIAAQYFAIKIPNFLQDLLIFSGGSGVMNKVHSSARFVQAVKSIVG